MGQLIPTSEIIIVTTPQIAAAEVAERAGRIAHQLKQQISGVVENMSPYISETGEEIALFGSGGGQETVERLSRLVGADIPLLAQIPFQIDIRQSGDNGTSIFELDEVNPAVQAFFSIADALAVRKRSLLGVRLGLST